jgi:hypothetical protein
VLLCAGTNEDGQHVIPRQGAGLRKRPCRGR